MRKIALYGKGGIGKSTTASNLTAALCEKGLRVMQIGCDPKSDSTSLLLHNNISQTVLDLTLSRNSVTADDLVKIGFGGSLCVECGGPPPGTGCAGRGIISALESLEAVDALGAFKPDIIIYDVLGDVVCGGFAMPIRNGYAKDVFVVTSGEMMSLYAANNISEAVRRCGDMGYARFGGLIQNSKNIKGEDALVDSAADEMGSKVIFRIPRSESVQECESKRMTVIEGAPDSDQAEAYRRLAVQIINSTSEVSGGLGNNGD